jgi:hypothetical protein
MKQFFFIFVDVIVVAVVVPSRASSLTFSSVKPTVKTLDTDWRKKCVLVLLRTYTFSQRPRCFLQQKLAGILIENASKFSLCPSSFSFHAECERERQVCATLLQWVFRLKQ